MSLAPNVLNPVFENELTYPGLRFPEAGYQLLGLFRYWNMVPYYYPDRDVMADDLAAAPAYWNHVLEEFIPAIARRRSPMFASGCTNIFVLLSIQLNGQEWKRSAKIADR